VVPILMTVRKAVPITKCGEHFGHVFVVISTNIALRKILRKAIFV
jgi:hypothetical protein